MKQLKEYGVSVMENCKQSYDELHVIMEVCKDSCGELIHLIYRKEKIHSKFPSSVQFI